METEDKIPKVLICSTQNKAVASAFDSFQECPRSLERTFGHGCPEIFVLGKVVVVRSGCVADDAETKERHTVDVASLGYGSRFHIDSQALWKMAFDSCQFVSSLYKTVTGTDESAMDTTLQRSTVVEVKRMMQQRRVGRVILMLSPVDFVGCFKTVCFGKKGTIEGRER